MRYLVVAQYVLSVWLAAVIFPLGAWAGEKLPAPETYMPHPSKIHQIKSATDDPRDLTVTSSINDVIPPEILALVHFDQEKMKKGTSEMFGYTAPELVGKIAPGIKPGKYTYRDLEKYPGFKELFPPELLQQVRAPGPPFVCSIEAFEIIPTRQIYSSLPQIEATKKNLGKTKLDQDGYIVPRSWQGGFPFPKPSGKFRAQQVYYNFEKRSDAFDKNFFSSMEINGYDKNLKLSKYQQILVSNTRFMGRVLIPPFGWFDRRAERNGEFSAFAYVCFEPRSTRGMGILNYHYDDPNKLDSLMIYVPTLRRIRKMSATDTQDPQGDLAYDDNDMLSQKITPKKFPYEFEIIDEREYLIPISYGCSPSWVDSKNHYTIRSIQFQRRPCYVLQMTQMDPNYIYGKRVFYIDKETFISQFAAYYDQKGRLYRSQLYAGYTFLPEYGVSLTYGGYTVQIDYVDVHSTFQATIIYPAAFSRKHFTLEQVVKMGK